MIVAVSDPTDVMAVRRPPPRARPRTSGSSSSPSPISTRTLDRCYRANVARRDGVGRGGRGRGTSPSRTSRDGDVTDAPAIKLVNQIIAQRDRRGRVGHPLRAAGGRDWSCAPGSTASCARSPTVQKALHARGHEPPEDHGRARHRRAPRAQDGRVSIRYGGQPIDLRIAVLPTTLRREGRAPDPAPRLGPPRARRARHEPRRRGGARRARSSSRTAPCSPSARRAPARRRRSTRRSSSSTTTSARSRRSRTRSRTRFPASTRSR